MKILTICGSPRIGNCEAVAKRLQKMLREKGVENEVVLLRKKKIEECRGCDEFCKANKICHIKDDMQAIIRKMEKVDGFIFLSPNYWKMPSGLMKLFIDRCNFFYVTGKAKQFKNKKAVVIGVGEDKISGIDVCTNAMADNFCKQLGMKVIGRISFRGRSDLYGNINDIFESGLNKTIEKDLEGLVNNLLIIK